MSKMNRRIGVDNIDTYTPYTAVWISEKICDYHIQYKNVSFEFEFNYSNCYYEGDSPSIVMMWYGDLK
jgi:hypothetical protein